MVTINGKQYPLKEVTYNFMCDLEDKDIKLKDIQEKPFRFIRLYLSYCMGASDEVAGDELQAHAANGGNFDDLTQGMTEAIENSAFFRAQQQTTKTSPTKSEEKSEDKK